MPYVNISRDHVPVAIGTSHDPYPTVFGWQNPDALGVLADGVLTLHSRLDPDYVTGEMHRNMPTPGMMRLTQTAIERRKPESTMRAQLVLGYPGAGKTFGTEVLMGLREHPTKSRVQKIDCGGLDLDELMFRTVLGGTGEPLGMDKLIEAMEDRLLHDGFKRKESRQAIIKAAGSYWNEDEARVDWEKLTAHVRDAQTPEEAPKQWVALKSAMTEVARDEGILFENARGDMVGIHIEKGPIILAWEGNYELLLDEYPKGIMGTGSSLHNFVEWVAGGGNPTFILSRAGITVVFDRELLAVEKKGVFYTFSGNKMSDGRANQIFPKSYYDRILPDEVLDSTLLDFQHRTSQMLAGVPIHTYYSLPGFAQYYDAHPLLFTARLLEYRVRGLLEEQDKAHFNELYEQLQYLDLLKTFAFVAEIQHPQRSELDALRKDGRLEDFAWLQAMHVRYAERLGHVRDPHLIDIASITLVEEMKNIASTVAPALHVGMIDGWPNVVRASREMGEFYMKLVQAITPDSEVYDKDPQGLRNLKNAISNIEYQAMMNVGMRFIIRHVREAYHDYARAEEADGYAGRPHIRDAVMQQAVEQAMTALMAALEDPDRKGFELYQEMFAEIQLLPEYYGLDERQREQALNDFENLPDKLMQHRRAFMTHVRDVLRTHGEIGAEVVMQDMLNLRSPEVRAAVHQLAQREDFHLASPEDRARMVQQQVQNAAFMQQFGARYIDRVMESLDELSLRRESLKPAVAKQLHQMLHGYAIEHGVHPDDDKIPQGADPLEVVKIARLLSLDPYNPYAHTEIQKMQRELARMMRRELGDTALPLSDEQLIPLRDIHALLRQLERLDGFSPESRDSLLPRGVMILSPEDDHLLGLVPLHDRAFAGEKHPSRDLLPLETLLNTLAMPHMRRRNLDALWNPDADFSRLIAMPHSDESRFQVPDPESRQALEERAGRIHALEEQIQQLTSETSVTTPLDEAGRAELESKKQLLEELRQRLDRENATTPNITMMFDEEGFTKALQSAHAAHEMLTGEQLESPDDGNNHYALTVLEGLNSQGKRSPLIVFRQRASWGGDRVLMIGDEPLHPQLAHHLAAAADGVEVHYVNRFSPDGSSRIFDLLEDVFYLSSEGEEVAQALKQALSARLSIVKHPHLAINERQLGGQAAQRIPTRDSAPIDLLRSADFLDARSTVELVRAEWQDIPLVAHRDDPNQDHGRYNN